MSITKTIRVRRYQGRADSEVEITLRPSQFSEEFEVWLGEEFLGRISSYAGSLDRTYRGNWRRPGRPRTLWSAQCTGERRENGMSRADAIRHLMYIHAYREAQNP